MADTELFEVFWPGGVRAVEMVSPAPRADLTNKRIGFLWDDMFRGDEIFQILEKNISEQFENVEFVGHRNFGPIFGGEEHSVLANLPNHLERLKINAIICGIGC